MIWIKFEDIIVRMWVNGSWVVYYFNLVLEEELEYLLGVEVEIYFFFFMKCMYLKYMDKDV